MTMKLAAGCFARFAGLSPPCGELINGAEKNQSSQKHTLAQ